MAKLNSPILEMRIALTTSDYERLVKFYCDGLGIEPAAIWDNDGGKALMLNMGRATLEIFDKKQAEVLVHPPVKTSWGDFNARLQDPDGMQVTLFQVSEENI